MADLRPLSAWMGRPAHMTVWRPTAAAMDHARAAPLSLVPLSHEQEQHLRAFRACEARGEEMARMIIVVWEEAGLCDLQAMSDVVTAHLRRHDTYHSWFDTHHGAIMRHVLADPSAIAVEPVELGLADAEIWQKQANATPSPFAWDCFQFGILQRADGFTCFASVDHRNADLSVIPLMMTEIHEVYRAAARGGGPLRLLPAGRYLDYCARQRELTDRMTLTDPGIAAWIDFLHRHDGRLPPFPLPLGVEDDRCLAEYVEVPVFEAAGMAAFEAACAAAGARVIGGLLACATQTGHMFAGGGRQGLVTPMSTRKSPTAFRTAGWCMGVVPIDLNHDNQDFAECARKAQALFEERLPLAHVPIERVLELAADLPTIRPAATGGMMLSYNDMSRPPLSPRIERLRQAAQGRSHISDGMAGQVSLWFFRTPRGLTLSAAYPANDTARASMRDYLEALRNACRAAATGSSR